jgi:transporter family protein
MIPAHEIPLALALFGFAFQGFSDFLLKRGVDKQGNPFSIIAMTVPTFLGTSILSGLLLGDLEFEAITIGYGLIAGFLSLVALNLFVISLKEGEVSVNSTLFRLNFVVTALMAIIILAESATWSKWTGLALAVGAIGSISWGGNFRRKGTGRATALAITALLIYGVNSFFFKIAALHEVSVPAYTVTTSLTFGALSIAAHFSPWKSVRIQPNRIVVRYGLLSGLIIGAAFNFMIWSLRLGGEASVVIPIFQLSFVLTAALGVIRLNEPMTLRKGIGFALAIGAIIVLAI